MRFVMAAHSKTEKKRRRTRMSLGDWIIIGIILIVVIGVASFLSQPPPPANTPTLTSIAPDFTLQVVGPNGITGQKVSLSSFRGKVVFLEFMVPQCIHCQNMAPVLNKLYHQYGGENIVFLSVSGSGPSWYGATADDVAKFMKTYNTNYPNWFYVIDTSNAVFSMYGVNSTPTFFIIAKNGQVAASYLGETPYETLATDLTRLSA